MQLKTQYNIMIVFDKRQENNKYQINNNIKKNTNKFDMHIVLVK